MFDKMAVYSRLPVWGQNLACCLEGERIIRTRYGKLFWNLLEGYEKHGTWSYEHLCEYRDKKLRRMIRHCYDTVPYYRGLFHEGGINPESIRRLDDLKVLPLLTKEIVNRNPEQFISSAVPRRKMLTAHTSGTTGAGFIFKTTQRAQCEQWAVWWRYRRRLGIPFGTWCALFGGRSVVPAVQKKQPFYRINKPGRQIYFSSYHMNEKYMDSYVNALEQYRLSWIHGYPSSIALLARYMTDRNRKLPYQIKWVTTGAENLLEQHKEAVYDAFGVIPYQHYGMSEGVANLSEDKEHVYRIDEDFACTEFLTDRTHASCRIAGTSLTNFAMPLVRYDTGDFAVVENGKRSAVLSVDGRREDYLVLSNGVKLGRLDHIFKDMKNVKEAQIRQNQAGKIRFLVVKGIHYMKADEGRLRQEIESRLGREPYQIHYVQKIEKNKSGKLRFVVSEMQEQTND